MSATTHTTHTTHTTTVPQATTDASVAAPTSGTASAPTGGTASDRPASNGRHPVEMLKRRWPTALAVALVILTTADGSGELADTVGAFGDALPLLPLLYVIIHQVGNPRVTWPVLGAGVAAMVALGAQDVVSQPVALVAIALAVLIWGAVRKTPHGRGTFGVQAAGAFGFGALALVGLVVDPDLGRYLVAAGWFFHGVWDFVHLKFDKVVARSFAEWCGVVDVLIAVHLLFLL
ncbi:hypothetical protein [Streptomyces phaeochromogenes]|uniref:hypothetical protein n=1 Tax=Streptomyces phaeochromogenes TaxID=1923 RepID=UPI002DD9CE00|nr:hypothetical protein [Streptomyces phaeochromogenes]WRZ27263.1 hypothetical protein OG931_05635 [Streptomyces phaeochromogenes]